VSELVHGPDPRRAGSTGSSRSARLGKALGTAATAAALMLGLPAGAAEAVGPGTASTRPGPGGFQLQRSVPKPSVPSFSSESSSVELPAAAQREMANAILHRVKSEAGAVRPGAQDSPPPTVAPNDASASFDPPSAAAVTGDPSAGPGPEAPVERAAGHERPASRAPVRSAPIETPGAAVLDESGGFRPEHRAGHRAHRWSSARAGSLETQFPPAAGDASARPPRGGDSTPTVPRDRAPWPPEHPGGALSAALASSSGTLFGSFMAALFILIACEAFGAPRPRSAPPSDRASSAPFIPRLERPG
jgi:hypothetical protein